MKCFLKKIWGNSYNLKVLEDESSMITFSAIVFDASFEVLGKVLQMRYAFSFECCLEVLLLSLYNQQKIKILLNAWKVVSISY